MYGRRASHGIVSFRGPSYIRYNGTRLLLNSCSFMTSGTGAYISNGNRGYMRFRNRVHGRVLFLLVAVLRVLNSLVHGFTVHAMCRVDLDLPHACKSDVDGRPAA